MGCILFCLTGMYLAVSGLGAGGSSAQQQHVISTASAITFGVYALSGWLGGTILNFVKPKLMIMLAAIGYPLYVGSLWYLNKTGNPWFTYLAGTILGIAAGMLWTAAGFISFAYASEDEKASFISIQWAIVSVGGSIGSLVAFGINYHAEESKASNTIYAVFISIMCIAILLALLFIVDPKHVTRSDGTHIAVFRQAKFSTELKRLAALFADWRVWILLPGMFVAEMNLVSSFLIAGSLIQPMALLPSRNTNHGHLDHWLVRYTRWAMLHISLDWFTANTVDHVDHYGRHQRLVFQSPYSVFEQRLHSTHFHPSTASTGGSHGQFLH